MEPEVMSADQEYKLPLGICKQIALKFESILVDLHDIMEDEDVSDDDKEIFQQMIDISGTMEATIINIVNKEIGEDEFMQEGIPMDEIGTYPGDDVDIMDQTLE